MRWRRSALLKTLLGVEIPDNARLVRNIIAGAQNVQDHVVHFYHLHALDWVDVTLALKADPAKTSQLAQSISEWPKSSTVYFKGVQDRVKALVASRQLSLFSSGDWGHPAYQLPPEANLLAVAHYIEALDMQRDFIRIHAVLGGKNPHLQTYLVGGMSTAIDGNEPDAVINPERITLFNELAARAKTFVEQVYVPDVLAVASFYKEWFGYGEGLGNFMAYGDFPSGSINDPADFFFPRGVILNRDISTMHPLDPGKVTESVAHSWYEYSGGDSVSLHPAEGQTNPKYSGPKPPFEQLDTDAKYSWLKSPRYDGKPMEVGPLARTLVAYASGDAQVKKTVDGVLAKFNAPPTALFSTLGRIAARAIESDIVVQQTARMDCTAGRQHERMATCASTTATSGTRRAGRSRARASDSKKRRAAHWATGSRSRTRRSSTTRQSCRPHGMPGRAMRRGSAARMKPLC